jgi:hypothetical protein
MHTNVYVQARIYSAVRVITITPRLSRYVSDRCIDLTFQWNAQMNCLAHLGFALVRLQFNLKVLSVDT